MDQDFSALASEVLRALRGRRSQRGFSALLGYRTNVVYRWEAGTRTPSAHDFCRASLRKGRGVRERLHTLDPRTQALADRAIDDPGFPAALLRLYQGGRTVAEIARAVSQPRVRVSRALAAKTQVKLPLFLQLLDALTGRMEDFVEAFVELSRAPGLQAQLHARASWRRLAYEAPLSEALTAVLESKAYQENPKSVEALAEQLGVDAETVRDVLQAQHNAGLISRQKGRWEAPASRSIDTRGLPESFAATKRYWARFAAERVETQAGAMAAYVIFCASEDATRRIEAIQRAAYDDCRAVLRQDTGNDRVVLLTSHWVPLDVDETADPR